MLDPSFNKKIRKIITILEYPMYVVIRDKNFKCQCRDINAVPDPHCMKCLGTGYRIKIKEIPGVMEPDDNPAMRMNEQADRTSMNYYYFNSEKVDIADIQRKNLIVRDDEVDLLMTPRQYRSDSNSPIYYYVRAIPMQVNQQLFLRNFHKVLDRLL